MRVGVYLNKGFWLLVYEYEMVRDCGGWWVGVL